MTNEIIESINRSLALFMTVEDLTDYELNVIQQAQMVIYRHKEQKNESVHS